MAVNKVMLGSETLLDLTGDTVTRATLLAGHTAHNAAGEQIEGEYTPPDVFTGHIRPGTATRCRGRKEVPVRRWQLGHTRSADND